MQVLAYLVALYLPDLEDLADGGLHVEPSRANAD